MHFISSKPWQLCTTDTGWEKFKVQLLELGTKPCHCWQRWGMVTHRHHLGCLVWTAWAAHPSVWHKGCKVGFLAGNCLSSFGAQLYKPDMTKPSACPLGLSLWGGPSVLSQLFCPVLSWLSCAVLALLCCSGCPVLSCAMLCHAGCPVPCCASAPVLCWLSCTVACQGMFGPAAGMLGSLLAAVQILVWLDTRLF